MVKKKKELMVNEVKLGTFVEGIYKNYSLYVLESRSIPDWAGIKRSQIKMLWVANDKCRNFTKTLAFNGIVVAYGNYHHAPDALSETIAKMAQDFAGGNNLPLIEGKGSFGSQTVPDGISAPRYTEVRLHNNFDYLFPNIDFKLLPNANDPENPEPKWLAPILPISLLNGTQGIAIGFATKIFPRNPLELIKMAEKYIDGKKYKKEVLPFYIDYNGTVEKIEDKVVMKGVVKKLSKKGMLQITELPLKYNLESYKQHLYKLRDDKGIVTKIVQDNSDSKFDITIKVTDAIYNLSNAELIQVLDLKMNMNENITMIGIEDEVKVFDSCNDYMEYFVEHRVNLYDERIKYIIEKNKIDITKQMIKLFLIDYIGSGKDKTKELLVSHVNKNYTVCKTFFKKNLKGQCATKVEFEQLGSDIINAIRLIDSFKDKEKEYNDKLNDLIAYRRQIQSTTKEDMYKEDLEKLKTYLKKNYKNRF